MIRNQEELAALLPLLEGNKQIAVDTEADSLHAYPEKLCLVQLSVPGKDVLVDPLAGYDLMPLLAALKSKELFLHGADYDLRLLYRTFRFVPKTVFDTMWAARLLGYTEFGLVHLVQHHLGVVLEKGPQKMNWGLRPLTERMSTYALNDTRFLRPLADLLHDRLREKGRLDWQREVCDRVIRECTTVSSPDPDSLWRIKGSDRLEPASLAVLRELWHWREEEARATNKPPFFILSHEKLLAIAVAATRQKTVQALLPHHLPAKRAVRLSAAITKGLRVAPSRYPQHRKASGRRLSGTEQAEFDRLKQVRDAQALALGMDPTVIASKSDLIALAKDPGDEEGRLMKWQRRLLIPKAS